MVYVPVLLLPSFKIATVFKFNVSLISLFLKRAMHLSPAGALRASNIIRYRRSAGLEVHLVIGVVRASKCISS